jgi:hypothetical protein
MKLPKAWMIILCFLSISIMSFSGTNLVFQAEVAKENDMYVFYLSEPTSEYEVLGEIRSGPVWFGIPSEMLHSVTRRARKKYDNAEGVIFLDKNMRRASVIKFK